MRTVTGLSHQPFATAAAAAATALDPDELDICPVGEALVHLQLRAQPKELRPYRVAADDGVRVADGHCGQLDPFIP